MRIAVDAMGGDHAPSSPIEGALLAARAYGVTIVFVGKPDVIEAELAKHDTAGLSYDIAPASEIIEMEDEPAMAARKKRDSSIVVGLKLLKSGDADGFFSAGNTGGVLAGAIFNVGRIKGVQRPALSTIFPTVQGHSLLLDIGANAEVKPDYLAQFALMGAIYADRVLGITRPRVGLVSNGEEEMKGTETIKEAHQLIKQMSNLNFIGNVEGKDVTAGMADVIVTDGFTGNVMIKLAEGLGQMTKQFLKEELLRDPMELVKQAQTPAGMAASLAGAVLTLLGLRSSFVRGLLAGLGLNTALLGSLAKRASDRISQRTDYSEYGGAPLLGIDGVVIIGHGRSNPQAVKNGVRVAKTAVEQNVVDAIRDGLRDEPADK